MEFDKAYQIKIVLTVRTKVERLETLRWATAAGVSTMESSSMRPCARVVGGGGVGAVVVDVVIVLHSSVANKSDNSRGKRHAMR